MVESIIIIWCTKYDKRTNDEQGLVLWTDKLMVFYQLARRLHETYTRHLFVEELKREAIKLIIEQQINIA